MAKSFLIKVMENFLSLTEEKKSESLKLLLAVSGGADSMAMLFSFLKLRKTLNIELFVLTVNHNIRTETESLGDTEFVLDFCKNKCPCFVAEIPKNAVFEEAGRRKTGIEDSARFLRYIEFEKAAALCNADYILTAHNKNDYYETVLMRFFQGSEPEALMGIASKRGKFIRPLLNITRSEIEEYLKQNNLSWREDSSNFENAYLRNNIRHKLIPALDLCFDAWQSGLENSLKKIKAQNNFVLSFYKRKKEEGEWILQKTEKNELFCLCNFNFFVNLDKILKYKFLQEGLILIKSKKRVPFSVFEDLLQISIEKPIILSGGFCIKKDGDYLNLFKKLEKKENADYSIQKNLSSQEFFYSIWINEPCSFDTPAGSFKVTKNNEGHFVIFENDKTCGIGPFKVPFCIRSRLFGDQIETVSGSKKSVKKIVNEWNIDYEKRRILPIIEEGGVVKGIYGTVVGKKNWYVLGVKK